jgi:hypothetical protein
MELREADSIEELAEMALIHLQDLGADALLIVHGDEGHAHPVTQVFYGLDYSQIETELWEWSSHDWTAQPVQSRKSTAGRSLTAALLDGSGDCLGWLHMRCKSTAAGAAKAALTKFAGQYLQRLLEICLLEASPFQPEPIEVVQTRSSLILSRLELEDSEESIEAVTTQEPVPEATSIQSTPAVDPIEDELELIRISEWQFQVDSEWVDLQDFVVRDSAI